MASDFGKLNVAFLFDDSLDRTDGVSQYVRTLGSWLSSQGHRVTYLVGQTKLTTWHGGEVISLSSNIKLRWAGNNPSISLIPKNRLIKQVLKTHKFDIVHVQVPYSPFMAQRVIKHLQDDTALVGTVHVVPGNLISSIGSRLLRLLYGRSFDRIDELLAVSSAADSYNQKAFKRSARILPNVVELSRFNNPMVAHDKCQIVFLGRLVERKGPLELLAAFNKLHDRLPKVKLIVAGDGPLRQKMATYVNKNSLNQNVEFLGFVPEEKKPSLLATADIACFPSLYGESFGIVLIEAMAAGSGVVLGGNNAGYATVLGARPELLIEPRDSGAFADRLYQLLTDSVLANKLHQWQQAEVKRYDVKTVGPQLLEIYKSTIAKRKDNKA